MFKPPWSFMLRSQTVSLLSSLTHVEKVESEVISPARGKLVGYSKCTPSGRSMMESFAVARSSARMYPAVVDMYIVPRMSSVLWRMCTGDLAKSAEAEQWMRQEPARRTNTFA